MPPHPESDVTRPEPVEGPEPDRTLRAVAIVGGGPRGISVLERLIANAELADDAALTVHLIDPAPVGGGRIWRHDQPQHLLMNTLCADATHFTDSSVTCDGPIVEGPTLYEWCRQLTAGEVEWDDHGIRAEAARAEPHSHPSRRLLGSYLRWCYLADCARLPNGFTVVEHQASAISCTPSDDHVDLGLDDGSSLTVGAVVLTTGHADVAPDGRARDRLRHAERLGLFYGQPANPIDQDLSAVEPGETLVLRGLGMNFFDYMSLLTVGRGGEFVEDGGELRYRPSGNEPVLAVGSGRGVPYRAKGLFGTMTPHFEPRYLRAHVVRKLEQRGSIDFRADLWPLIAKDTAVVYYRVLGEQHPEAFEADPQMIMEALDTWDWDSDELRKVIAAVVPRGADRADFANWDQPLSGKTFESPDAFTAWWLDDLRHDLAEARLGMASAYKCASVAMGQGRGPLRQLVRYGGLLGDSYNLDIDRWFKGFAGSLASGPPAQRIAELIALTEAGLVHPIGPKINIDDTADGFTASSPQVTGSLTPSRAFLEAYLPAPDLARTADPLAAHLRDHGHARPYSIPNRQEPGFLSGALEVGPPPYRVIDARGHEQPRIFAAGVPVEGLHFGTQLGPLAHTNSRFLRDSDAVARATLSQLSTDSG